MHARFSSATKLFLILLVFYSFLFVVNCIADDMKYLNSDNQEMGKKEVGRSANGQAYRVDQDGTKIADYLAELELASLELTRSLQASQDEVKSLSAEIERLKSGRQDFVVKENNLIESTAVCDAISLKQVTQRELTHLLSKIDSRDILLSQKTEFADNPLFQKIQSDLTSLAGNNVAKLEEQLAASENYNQLLELRVEINQIRAELEMQLKVLE